MTACITPMPGSDGSGPDFDLKPRPGNHPASRLHAGGLSSSSCQFIRHRHSLYQYLRAIIGTLRSYKLRSHPSAVTGGFTPPLRQLLCRRLHQLAQDLPGCRDQHRIHLRIGSGDHFIPSFPDRRLSPPKARCSFRPRWRANPLRQPKCSCLSAPTATSDSPPTKKSRHQPQAPGPYPCRRRSAAQIPRTSHRRLLGIRHGRGSRCFRTLL